MANKKELRSPKEIREAFEQSKLKDLIDKGFNYRNRSAVFGLIGKLPKPASSNKLLV